MFLRKYKRYIEQWEVQSNLKPSKIHDANKALRFPRNKKVIKVQNLDAQDGEKKAVKAERDSN